MRREGGKIISRINVTAGHNKPKVTKWFIIRISQENENEQAFCTVWTFTGLPGGYKENCSDRNWEESGVRSARKVGPRCW